MDEFVQLHLPALYNVFIQIPVSIVKLDIFRLILIYIEGGIYLDLDIFVYKNFYDTLSHTVSIQETIESIKPLETIQNALICGAPNNSYIKKCIEVAIKRAEIIMNHTPHKELHPDLVKYIAGPNLMGDVYNNFDDKTQIQWLPNHLYNPELHDFNGEAYCKHLMTGL
jgi:mannosyltransferase OCH1-like enzyme